MMTEKNQGLVLVIGSLLIILLLQSFFYPNFI
jgi:hypothetical protein